MAEEIKGGSPAGPPRGGTPPGVESSGAPDKPRTNPVPAPTGALPGGASASVPLFGGNRGGRRRNDGLAPGSPEALEADRKKDRDRKLAVRRLAEPTPLPSAGQTSPSPGQTQVNGQGTDLVPVAGEQGSVAPAELWDPGMFEDLVSEGLDLCEKKRIHDLAETAQAAALSQALVAEIKRDAAYNPAFKATVSKAGPRALAKTLNRLGVSAKYSDEGLCALAMLSLWFQGWRLQARLEELIEKDRKEKAQRENQASAIREAAPAAGPAPVKR